MGNEINESGRKWSWPNEDISSICMKVLRKNG
jgi:hypothetical protein